MAQPADSGAAPVLPEPVRQRVLALAAQALGAMPVTDVPAPLRRFASFAPSRRAKLSASVLGPVLEADEHFRKLVAFEVGEAESAGAGGDQVEHRPAEAEAAGLAGEAADDLGAAFDLG